jgi:hypothetical protein
MIFRCVVQNRCPATFMMDNSIGVVSDSESPNYLANTPSTIFTTVDCQLFVLPTGTSSQEVTATEDEGILCVSHPVEHAGGTSPRPSRPFRCS